MRLFLIIVLSLLQISQLNFGVSALSSARIYECAQKKLDLIGSAEQKTFAINDSTPYSDRRGSCDPVQVRIAILNHLRSVHHQTTQTTAERQIADSWTSPWACQWISFQDEVIDFLIETSIRMQVALREFTKKLDDKMSEKDRVARLFFAYARVYEFGVPENILDRAQHLSIPEFTRVNQYGIRTYTYSGPLRHTFFNDFLLSAGLSRSVIADITTKEYQALWTRHNPHLFDQPVTAQTFPLLSQFITRVCGQPQPPVVKIRFAPFIEAMRPMATYYEGGKLVIRIDAILMQHLTELEIKALLFHEIGHLAPGHFASMQGCSVSSEEFQQQELEADLFACRQLGKDASALKSALTKCVELSLLNGVNRDADEELSSTHPALAERIASIDAFIRELN